MATCISAIPKSPISIAKVTKREIELSLIERAQRGDDAAFAILFQLHNRRVYAICLRMTKDASEAEDLMQDSFMQVFRNLSRFRGDSAFSTWLHRVVVNTVLMKFRQRKQPMASLDEPLSPDSPSLRREYGKTDPNLSGALDRISIRRAIWNCRLAAEEFLDFMRFMGTGITRSQNSCTAPLAIRNRSCTKRRRRCGISCSPSVESAVST